MAPYKFNKSLTMILSERCESECVNEQIKLD